MSTAGPFSLLLEWLTSPQVVGSFTIFGVGAVIAAIFGGLSSYFNDKECYTLEAVFGISTFVVVVVAFVCSIAFNIWVGDRHA